MEGERSFETIIIDNPFRHIGKGHAYHTGYHVTGADQSVIVLFIESVHREGHQVPGVHIEPKIELCRFFVCVIRARQGGFLHPGIGNHVVGENEGGS